MDCAICQETCFEYGPTHKLECGHEFHANCIVSWFRSGQKSCPICRDETHSNVTNDMKYLKRLAKMKSCPAFIKDAIVDYHKMKEEIKDLKNEVELFEVNAEGRYHIIKDNIKALKSKLKSKKSILKNAKDNLCNCHVFILPIKKTIFID